MTANSVHPVVKQEEEKLFSLLAKQNRLKTDIDYIKRAYAFAYKAHDGQVRKSEEPYIIHPINVAILLADLDSDKQTIASGLLHDVIEDCNIDGQQIEENFGSDVRLIVEGVTKLGKLSFSSKEERQAENFRKLIVAVAEDVRTLLVKLSDRLHNMRTLDHMAPYKQAEIAKETLEIYAPLANRFGLGQMKWELEDLGLKYLHPAEYAEITNLVAQSRDSLKALIDDTVNKIKDELNSKKIKAEITGRPKHLFGIWKKMKTQNKSFHDLYDILAVRIIISSIDDKEFCDLESDPDTAKCYEVMGLIHNLFKPIPGRFKDYIAMPKMNNYQSLHTAVIGSTGKPIEIQIRTERMHHIAEYGFAAHWRYKESGQSVKADSSLDKKLAWLRNLVEWQQDLKDAQEYLDVVKMDLFSDEVFVFSPKGDVYDLPSGSSPIDFAYRIHTDVGNKCVGARINDRIVPLNTVLKNGDILDIITSKNAHPTLDWLNFAKTHQAKNRIRQWFKKYHREEHILQGRQMLEAEIGKSGLDEFLKSDKVRDVGKKLNIVEPNDILAAIGYGDLSVAQVVNKVKDDPEKSLKNFSINNNEKRKQSNVGSLGGLLHHLAKCCQPVPGEEIVGVISRGDGIAVHKIDCYNLSKVDEDRRMAVDWSKERVSKYPAGLVVECLDRVGIAGDILKKISDSKINLRDLKVETHKQKKIALIHIILDVQDVEQLNKVSQSISQISDVIKIYRKDNRSKNSVSSNLVNNANNVATSVSKTAKITPISDPKLRVKANNLKVNKEKRAE